MSVSRKGVLGLTSLAGLGLFAVILVLVNLVSYRYFVRWDFTEFGIYSLSDSARRVLSGLPDPIRIRAFLDEKLPAEYANHRRYLVDLLKEMSAVSRGKVAIDWVDMKKPESKEAAMRAGILPLRFTAVRSDKFEIQEGMMGLVLYYEDRKEVIGAVVETRNIEYELVSRILKLTRPSSPVLGWATGHGEHEASGELLEHLTRNFDLRRLDRFDTVSLSGLSALVVAGPRSPVPDTELRALDGAIVSGLPSAFLVDFYDVHMGNFFARKNETGLDRLLLSYGLRPKWGLVADAQNVPVQMESQSGIFRSVNIVHYPFIPRVTDLSADHPVTRTLQEMALPFVSAFEVQDTSGMTILARSTPQSFRIENPFVLSPMEPLDVRGAEPGPFVLGAAIQASRPGAYRESGGPAEGRIRLVVLASGNFMDESHGGSGANLVFAANLIDWLSASEELIAIRSKTNVFRPLKTLSDDGRKYMKAANLFLMPALVAVAGLLRWQLRRRRRMRWESSAG